MTDTLRVGIIGYGKVGKIRHECVKSHPQLELVGVCDVNQEACALAGCKGFADYKTLLGEAKPDMIFICTFNKFIPEIAVEAIERGIHVFSEKPPGRTLEDVRSIYDAATEKSHVKVKFGFNHRYHEGVIEAKTLVDGKRFGEVMWMRGVYGKAGGPDYDKNWRSARELSGGGILIDQGIHMIDLFRFFSGEFEEVKSFVDRSFWKSVDIEDNVFALLKNKKGQTAMLHSSATQWRHKFLLEIYLEKGYLDKNGYPLPNPQENISYYDNDTSWMDEINEFVDCILKDTPVDNGGVADAVSTMDLVQRIYKNDNNKYTTEGSEL